LSTDLKLNILDSRTFAHSTFSVPVPRWMKMQRHSAETPEPVASPPCKHVFGNNVPPCCHRKTDSGSVVAVATHDAHATLDHSSMLPPSPARFEANTVAEYGRSLTNVSPLCESLIAFTLKTAKCAVWFDAAPQFLKHVAAWDAASKTGTGAAGFNLKAKAASEALIGLLVSCFAFPNILLATGFYEFVTGRPHDAIFHLAVIPLWSSPNLFLLPDSTFLKKDPRCSTLSHQRTEIGMLSSVKSFSTASNILLSGVALFVQVMKILLSPAPPRRHAFIGGKLLHLPSAQPNEHRHASNPSTDAFVPNLILGAIFILVEAAVRHAMRVVRRCSANKLSRHMSLGRPHRSFVISVIFFLLCCASCLYGAAGADTEVSVDPLLGKNVLSCGQMQMPPCQTIEYYINKDIRVDCS
jgi:hypothetical protein